MSQPFLSAEGRWTRDEGHRKAAPCAPPPDWKFTTPQSHERHSAPGCAGVFDSTRSKSSEVTCCPIERIPPSLSPSLFIIVPDRPAPVRIRCPQTALAGGLRLPSVVQSSAAPLPSPLSLDVHSPTCMPLRHKHTAATHSEVHVVRMIIICYWRGQVEGALLVVIPFEG